MTTDEGAKNNGESPTATVAEQGEDITSKKDRGVLKVRSQRCITYRKD
jgi:FK506-binding protein 4/5